MNDELKIIETSDGSKSISSKKFDATYHSIHGALQESMHIFINAGIHYKRENDYSELSIFEMGFGTGLNTFLSWKISEQFNISIDYHSIELHPIQKEIYSQLDYSKVVEFDHSNFQKLHDCEWEKRHQLSDQFIFHKTHQDLSTIEFESKYDLIFYDAFAPNAQSHLWEEEIHRKLYQSLNNEGALVTYCAQGKFKRTLKEIGYQLDKLPGPGRKHEMTRAVKRQPASHMP